MHNCGIGGLEMAVGVDCSQKARLLLRWHPEDATGSQAPQPSLIPLGLTDKAAE